jgi:hypothetical protein
MPKDFPRKSTLFYGKNTPRN